MTRAATVLLALLAGAGCGKYGPPVRAGQEKPPERKPSFEVPLPGAPSQRTPEPEPAREAPPAVEEEPPPEGSP